MIRRLLLAAAAVLVAHGASGGGDPNRLFETKLSPEEKIQQALNRLTFGARPGDIEEVRRLGLEKWIELQLHPERIAENPLLDTRLKPLETIRMDAADILKQYSPQRVQGMMIWRRARMSCCRETSSARCLTGPPRNARRPSWLSIPRSENKFWRWCPTTSSRDSRSLRRNGR